MTADTTSNAAAKARGVSILQAIVFAAPGVTLGALQVAFTVYLPRYFAGHIGIGAAIVAASVGLVRLIDIPLDPVLGVMIDHTRTRIGRYRLWMAIGLPIFMFSVFMVFFAQKGAGAGYLVLWLLLIYVGASCITLAHISWASVLAPTYRARSILFGVIGMVGVVGAALVNAVPAMLGKGAGEPVIMHAMGIFIMAAAPVGALLAVLAAREPAVAEHTHDEANPLAFVAKLFREYGALIVRPEVARLMAADLFVTLGPGWMSALYIYFFEDSRGFDFQNASKLLTVYLAAGLIGAPTLGWLAAAIGKHRTMIVACTGYSLGLVLLFFMPKSNLFIDGPFMFGMGFLAAGFNLLIRAMVADVGDQVRLETGRQTIGVLYSLVTSTTKVASALSIFFTFNMLAVIGYQTVGGVHNRPEVIHKLELTYLVGPILFVMLAGACFVGYRLNATRHGDIRRQLDARDAPLPEPPGVEGLASEAAGTIAPIGAAE